MYKVKTKVIDSTKFYKNSNCKKYKSCTGITLRSTKTKHGVINTIKYSEDPMKSELSLVEGLLHGGSETQISTILAIANANG